MARRQRLGFSTFLAVVSIMGFIAVVLNTWTPIDIGVWVDGLIFIIIGIGLAMVGGLFSIREYFRDGLTGEEVSHIITALLGVVAVGVGLVALTPIESPVADALRGFVALFAIGFIALETWVVKKKCVPVSVVSSCRRKYKSKSDENKCIVRSL